MFLERELLMIMHNIGPVIGALFVPIITALLDFFSYGWGFFNYLFFKAFADNLPISLVTTYNYHFVNGLIAIYAILVLIFCVFVAPIVNHVADIVITKLKSIYTT